MMQVMEVVKVMKASSDTEATGRAPLLPSSFTSPVSFITVASGTIAR
jgi:hypothetical protein